MGKRSSILDNGSARTKSDEELKLLALNGLMPKPNGTAPEDGTKDGLPATPSVSTG